MSLPLLDFSVKNSPGGTNIPSLHVACFPVVVMFFFFILLYHVTGLRWITHKQIRVLSKQEKDETGSNACGQCSFAQWNL